MREQDRKPLSVVSTHPQTILQRSDRHRVADVDVVILKRSDIDVSVRAAEHLGKGEALMRIGRDESKQRGGSIYVEQVFQTVLKVDPGRDWKLAAGCHDVASRQVEMLQQSLLELRS